jgi:hypothetical protein
MSVEIDASKGFQAGTTRRMFAAPEGALSISWDLSPDGKHFLFVAPPNTGRVVPFTVILNWAAAAVTERMTRPKAWSKTLGTVCAWAGG